MGGGHDVTRTVNELQVLLLLGVVLLLVLVVASNCFSMTELLIRFIS